MPNRLIFELVVLGGVSLAVFLFYWLYYSRKVDREETIDILRKNGIGDQPETITKNYYKTFHNENLDERKCRKLTRQFIKNNKEFFLTMYSNTEKAQKREKP